MQGDLHFLVAEEPASGVRNMQQDWDLLARAEEEDGPATWIRFYRWDRPTISLGKHQRPEQAVCLESCRELGIPIVHRPTGGRAVLHEDELTYAVISNAPQLTLGRSVSESYARIAAALAFGLQRLGLEADQVSRVAAPQRFSGLVPPCFVTHSRFELTWQGRKLAGSAQRRLRRSFLQHGSLPLSLDYLNMGKVFRTAPEVLRSRICSLQEALGWRPGFDQTRRALTEGLQQVLGVASGKTGEGWEADSSNPARSFTGRV